jgi:hypothetical protein
MFREEYLKTLKQFSRTALGVKSELDAALLLVISFFKELGYTTMFGIDDQDQKALADSRKIGKGGKTYGPRFARFGFAPPDEGSRFWKFDLRTLEMLTGGSTFKPKDLEEYASLVRGRKIPGEQMTHTSWMLPRHAEAAELAKLKTNILVPSRALANSVRQIASAPRTSNSEA